MQGLPRHLTQQLRRTLARCGPFDSNAALQRVFIDTRIQPWAEFVPASSSRQDRIDSIIALLYEQKTSQTGENALALFLLVLSERRQPGDACHQELATLARQVTEYAGGGVANSEAQVPIATPPAAKNITDNRGIIIEGPVNESTITIGSKPGQLNLLWPIFVVVVIISMGVAFLVWRKSLEGNAPPSTPAATITASPPPSLPATVTPLPSLAVFPALAEQALQDVAAANGHAWFATTEGLFHYQAATDSEPVQVVAATLVAVAVAPTGTEVWFSAGGAADAGAIGRYRLGEEDATWLPQSAAANLVTTMRIDADGILWFGDIAGNLYRLRPEDEQPQLLPPPDATLPVIRVYDLALMPGQAQTIWLVGDSYVYRWQADDWVDILPGDMVASGVLNAVASDRQGRAWFGHAAGITVYKSSPNSNLRRECPVADLDSQLVTDVAVGNAGTALWVVTRSGLAWLDISSETIDINDCANWAWQTFTEDSFWQPDPQSTLYRLAIDATPDSQTSTIWLVRRGTGKIRYLSWPSN